MRWGASLLAQTGDWIVTYSPPGTVVRHQTKRLSYQMAHHSFGVFHAKTYYNVFIDVHPEGAFKMLYCNIATPAAYEDGMVIWHDLELDVVRKADSPARIIDIDEFEEAQASGSIPPALAATAEATATELLELVRNEAFPFVAADYDQVLRVLTKRFGPLGMPHQG